MGHVYINEAQLIDLRGGSYNIGSCSVNSAKIFHIFSSVLSARRHTEEYSHKEMIPLSRLHGKNPVCSILYTGVIELLQADIKMDLQF